MDGAHADDRGLKICRSSGEAISNSTMWPGPSTIASRMPTPGYTNRLFDERSTVEVQAQRRLKPNTRPTISVSRPTRRP